jgi:integrase
MPFRDNKTRLWVGRIRHQGRAYGKRGFKTKREAENWETQKWDELRYPERYASLPDSHISALIDKYLTLHSKEHDAPKTHGQKVFVLECFKQFLKTDKLIKDITPLEIRQYLHARKKANDNDTVYMKLYPYMHKKNGANGATVANRDLRTLKSMFAWGYRNLIVHHNPCIGVEKYGETPKSRYVPTASEVAKVRLVASGVESDLIETLFFTAARLSEILRLKWDDVNMEKKQLVLRTRKRKGGGEESDLMTIPSKLIVILRKRYIEKNECDDHVFQSPTRAGRYINYDFRFTMNRLCKKAEVEQFGFHSLRHHVASRVAGHPDMSLHDVQGLLRHKRKTTTELYLKSLHVDFSRLARVLDEL